MIQFKYKVVIQFNGGHYHGWQIQNDSTATIQKEFNQALRKIFKADLKSTGSGRTDAGVHAKEFHVVFEPSFEIPADALVKALNGNLPDDIRALSVSKVDKDFRPTNDAISKEYRYYFTTSPLDLPFSKNLMSFVKYDLDLASMQKACTSFIGEHDFKNFHCLGSDPGTTIREIFECELVEAKSIEGFVLPDLYYLRIKGNGFLKQMVRLIVGAIWDVGRGKITISDIEQALKSPEFKHISPVAPAGGLYKYSVQYP